MPANLTPEYKKAEELLRQAKTIAEKISALELMLQTIPKHKGTDHMQADIKRRLSKLRSTPQTRAGARQGDIFYIPKGPVGGQVVLLGMPNSGKSSIVGALTNANVQVADFPFSTTVPVPGVMKYEDIPIQLVDMPPITRDHVAPGQTNAYRQSDLILGVVDLSATDVTDQVEICLDFLRQRTLIPPEDTQADETIYRHMVRPCLWAATKADLTNEGDFEVLHEIYRDKINMTCTSAKNQDRLKDLIRRIFRELRILRIYSKIPGKPPDMGEPFILPIGATVLDLALKVHRELAEKLRFARAWGQDKYPGQQVPRDYILRDKDIIELHFA
ncbi:MAG: hypothetical protein AMJ79_03945 [Phycisphaerae bacterium SM23_30]|nr:MAG: hypothetical protein AMJ79_03945 [Phycisphaerae bacterium SM23_30]